MDYSLAYLGLLAELSRRRLTIFGVRPDDSHWPAAAEALARILRDRLLIVHRDYYRDHPHRAAELDRIVAGFRPTKPQSRPGPMKG